MPHDLFGDVAARPQSVRSRRSPLVFVSLGAHAVLVIGVVVTSIVAPDALPFPEKAIAWEIPVPVRLVDIPLPPSPRTQPRHAGPSAPGPVPPDHTPEPRPAVETPVEAPDGVRPETGNEGPGGGGRQPVPEPTWLDNHVPGHGLPVVEKVDPPPSAPVRLHSGIQAPRRFNDAAPVYPAIAREAQVQGVVIIEATIDPNGHVVSAQVLRSIPLLDDAALNAVRQWRFEPARLNGQPVAVIMTVTVKFTLNR